MWRLKRNTEVSTRCEQETCLDHSSCACPKSYSTVSALIPEWDAWSYSNLQKHILGGSPSTCPRTASSPATPACSAAQQVCKPVAPAVHILQDLTSSGDTCGETQLCAVPCLRRPSTHLIGSGSGRSCLHSTALCLYPACLKMLTDECIWESGSTAKDVFFSTTSHSTHTSCYKSKQTLGHEMSWCLEQLW